MLAVVHTTVKQANQCNRQQVILSNTPGPLRDAVGALAGGLAPNLPSGLGIGSGPSMVVNATTFSALTVPQRKLRLVQDLELFRSPDSRHIWTNVSEPGDQAEPFIGNPKIILASRPQAGRIRDEIATRFLGVCFPLWGFKFLSAAKSGNLPCRRSASGL